MPYLKPKLSMSIDKDVRLAPIDTRSNNIGQLVNAGLRRIDNQVSRQLDIGQHRALRRDGHTKLRALVGEWVPAPGFAIALQQNLIAGVQEYDVCGDVLLTQLAQQVRQRIEVFRSVSGIESHREVLL